MLRKSRLYFFAIVTALVTVSLLITSGAKACEDAPQTWLSLYMSSDLIVIAKYDSESEPAKSNEDEYGYSLNTERKLVFTKIYKGQTDLQSVSFEHSTYVSKMNQNSSEAEETVSEEEHYFNVSKIKIGTEYLFFLSKDKETGKYSVTDYVSGVKELGENQAFYEKTLDELGKIAAAKENQYELLTEWMVKNIENAETRDEGIEDLSGSFYGMTYQDADPNFKDKGPFVVSEEGYGVYTVGVAKRLTQVQKDRVSGVLYSMLEEAWFAEKPQYVSYGVSGILGGIDKPRLALYTYSSLQKVAKNDVERKRIISEFLIDILGDEDFSKIFYEIYDLETKIDEAKKINTPQGKKQLKDLTALKKAKSKELDERFRFLQSVNFVIENKVS